MIKLRQWITEIPRGRLVLAAILIIIGLVVTVYYGGRAAASFRQIQYIHQQGLDRGTASVAAIRPWMTIRFIAVAYAVPEEYLYSHLNIPFDRRNENRSLGDLNRDYALGQSTNGNYPAIIDQTQVAILAYRANPVVTGLRDVRPWMSIHYISNSTGVPEAYIFEKIGLPLERNADKPLEILGSEQHYRGGLEALLSDVQRALTDYAGQP